ncbi:MAG: hypothetical protein H6Q68_3267 [Firmicutes bacterium]|nr:hypothetical protein [Bacillota bacterium]
MKKIKIIEVFSGDLMALRNISTVIISFGIVLLCVIWIGIYYQVHNERQMNINGAIKESSNLARTFEEHTLRTIKNADQTVLFLKYQYEKEGLAIDIPRYVSEGKLTSQPFVLLSIADENGNLVFSSQIPFMPSNLKDREHFLVHKNVDSGQLFISKPVLGRSSGKWSIQMTRRVNKPDGSFGGVVILSIDPYYFAEFYKQVDLGENSSITLIGRDGIVRARRSGQNTDIGQDLSKSILTEKLKISDRGYYTAYSPVDGIKRIYSYRALSDYPFTVSVGVDEGEILQSVDQRIGIYYLVAGMITAVVIGFIIILLRVTARQKRAEEALKHAHDDLELKVEQRTQELFDANEELTAMNEELQNVNQELEEEITERKRAEEQLTRKTEDIWHMAYFDALTSLPNRAHLNKWLNEEMEKTRRRESSGAVLFIDLDDLKMVNDTFGHTCGDDIIIMAGSRIIAEAGNKAFVARIGGDEFIVVLPDISDHKQITNIADRIIKALGKEHEAFGTCFHVSASIGIAIYPFDGDTGEEIFKNADNAMYAAKKTGKSCWRLYAADMQAEAYETMVLTNSLRYAIERRELSLYYQPQVRIDGRTIVGFEALLRWNSSEHGSVSPVRFIPLAEQSGIIRSIGQWVLREACQFVRRLTEKGMENIHVAVNVSPKQLTTSDFIDNVRDILNEVGIEPCQLEIEITESVLMVSVEDIICKLVELRGLGVCLSLDDFGVGYSSLTYLRQLPVDTLKIDKSFIDMIENDTNAAEIIGAIINMAHILKKDVIAEGVETEQQLRYLADNECDCVQGYIFSRPLPEAEAINILCAYSNSFKSE